MQRGFFISFYALLKYFCKIKNSVSKLKKEYCCFANFERKHFMAMKLNISFLTKLIWNVFNIFRNSSNSSFLWLKLLLLLLWNSAISHPAFHNLCLKHRACTEDTCFCSSIFSLCKSRSFCTDPSGPEKSSYAPVILVFLLYINRPVFIYLIF